MVMLTIWAMHVRFLFLSIHDASLILKIWRYGIANTVRINTWLLVVGF
jgi:hypothetical protein